VAAPWQGSAGQGAIVGVVLTSRLRTITSGIMELDFLAVLMIFAAGFAFVFATLTVGRIFRPHNPSADKSSIYECGERPIGEAWIQFNPRFYLIALIFLIFDVELAFIFPIATVFNRMIADGNGGIAFAEMFVFMAILFLGLIYVWAKGDLMWVKNLEKRPGA